MKSASSPPRSFLFAISYAVARLLLRLHPVRFREMHAAEMQLLFAERYAEERARGGWRLVKFLLRTFVDLAAGVVLTRRRAPRQFSPSQSFKGDAMFTQFIQDVRFALRMMGKSPGFAVLAIVTLALGIGASTTIFSVVYGVVLRPLPYGEPEQLVAVNQSSAQNPVMSVAFPNFLDWQKETRSFESMGAFRSQDLTLTGEGEPERIQAQQMTAGLFTALRTPPLLGRVFGREEDRHGATPVVVLSESFWSRRFGRDPGVLSRTILLGNERYTVIGVMPHDFQPPGAEVFVSLGRWERGYAQRGQYPSIAVTARLKAGVSLEQARADMQRIAASLAAQYESNRGQGAVVNPLLSFRVRHVQGVMWVLLGAVAFVLLIACANVANLLLARATGRQREIAVRRALGAGQLRLVRQLMTESLLLSLTGGIAGLVLTFWAVDAIIALQPNLPRLEAVRVDGAVLGFALAITLLTNFFFGLAPAWMASRLDLAQTMREGSRGTARGHAALRHGLLIAEVACALILVVGAGLTLRSLMRLVAADAGVNPQGVLTGRVSLPFQKYPDLETRRQFFSNALARLQSMPGVVHAGLVQPVPFGGEVWFRSYIVEGEPFPETGMTQTADNFHVSPDYFRAAGIPLLRGRSFTAADRAGSEEVCIVDEVFARKHFANGDAMGKRLAWGFGWNASQKPQRWATIVGVVGHVKGEGADRGSRLQIYNSFEQAVLMTAAFTVRTAGDPASAAPLLREAVRSVDADVALFQVKPMSELASTLSSDRRVITMLLNVFALIALALASVGIYGVMSYTVAQRTQEIGIRVALGARPADVYNLVLGNGARLVITGLTIGVLAALAMSQALQGILFGVTGHDPLTYIGVAALLAAIALFACWLPARRATRVSPLVALRSE